MVSFDAIVGRVENNLASLTIDYSKKKYLILCSAGVDSIVLADIISQLAPKENILLLYINYQLRPAENIEEEKIIKNFGKEKKISWEIKEFNLPKYFSNHSGNLQDLARKIRFNEANQVCHKKGYDYILTGYHQDDYRETFFLKLFQGVSPNSFFNLNKLRSQLNKKVLRPLFTTTKKEITHYAKVNNLKFFIDSTNQKNSYLRNNLRNLIFPLLNTKFPHWEKNIFFFNNYLSNFLTLSYQQIKTYLEIKDGFVFLKLNFYRLNFSLSITLVHYSFNKLYPEKRFSSGFLSSTTKKILAGNKGKTLATIDGKKIVFSYRLIGEEQVFLNSIPLKKGEFCLHGEVGFFFNYNEKQFAKSPASLKKIFIFEFNLNEIILEKANLQYEINFYPTKKKMTFKKILENYKIPQMLRNSLIAIRGNNAISTNPQSEIKEGVLFFFSPYEDIIMKSNSNFSKLKLILKRINLILKSNHSYNFKVVKQS